MCAFGRGALTLTGLRAQQNTGVNDVRGGTFGSKTNELYTDAFTVMPHHPACHVSDQNELANRRLDSRLKRNAARREVHHVALYDRAVAAREAGLRLRGYALIAAQIA